MSTISVLPDLCSHSLSKCNQSDGEYRASIMRSPRNLLPPLIALLCFSFCGWPLVLLAITLQLMSWLLLPRIAWVRRGIDSVEASIERQRVVAARASLLSRIDVQHRTTFECLEALLEDVSQSASALDDRDLSLRWLLSHYLRLAIAQKPARERLTRNSQETYLADIALLEQQKRVAPPRLVKSLEQRELIARQRLVLSVRSSAELECMEAEMASISALMHLAHESIVAPARYDSAQLDIDGLIAQFAGSPK